MGLWAGHLAGDQGTGFNPDSVLLSSERFPCHLLCCLFGWLCLEGRAEPFPRVAVAVPGVRGCDAAGGEAPPPSGPFRAQSHGQSNIRGFLLAWQLQLIYGQALEWPKREAGHQQLSRGRTCIPQAPLSSWGTSMRNLTSLF